MKQLTIVALLGLMAAGLLLADTAQAIELFSGRCAAMQSNWHQGYYQGQWGAPLALVVPPTVNFQTDYGNTVASMRVTRIWPQFKPYYPGHATPGHNPKYKPVPLWPTDTTQMGVYYIRGPW